MAIHDALFKAYFVDGVNLAAPDELVRIAVEARLDADQAKEVIETRSFFDAVDADWRRSAQFGVTAVPTFAAGGYAAVGAQPYEVLEKLVVKAIEEPVTRET